MDLFVFPLFSPTWFIFPFFFFFSVHYSVTFVSWTSGENYGYANLSKLALIKLSIDATKLLPVPMIAS